MKTNIDNEDSLESENKQSQKNVLDRILTTANESLNGANTADDITNIFSDAKNKIESSYTKGDLNNFKQAKSDALKQSHDEVITNIDKDSSLTLSDKQIQKNVVDKSLDLGKEIISEAKTADEVNDVLGKLKKEIAEVHVSGKHEEQNKPTVDNSSNKPAQPTIIDKTDNKTSATNNTRPTTVPAHEGNYAAAKEIPTNANVTNFAGANAATGTSDVQLATAQTGSQDQANNADSNNATDSNNDSSSNNDAKTADTKTKSNAKTAKHMATPKHAANKEQASAKHASNDDNSDHTNVFLASLAAVLVAVVGIFAWLKNFYGKKG